VAKQVLLDRGGIAELEPEVARKEAELERKP